MENIHKVREFIEAKRPRLALDTEQIEHLGPTLRHHGSVEPAPQILEDLPHLHVHRSLDGLTVPALPLPKPLDEQAGLADTATAVDRQQPSLGRGSIQLPQLGIAVDEIEIHEVERKPET